MSKKKSKKRVIILVAVLVLAALLLLGYISMQAAKAQNEKTTYNIVTVQRGNIEVKVKGAGTVEPLNDESVYAASAGTVVDVLAENGDTVSADDVIATFKNDDLEAQKDSLQSQIDELDMSINTLRSATGSDYVKSPIKGTVMTIYAAKGDSVDAVMDKYGALAIVSPDDMLQVTVPYALNVAQGDEVTVASGSQSATGTVTGVDTAAGEMTIQFEKNDFKAGDIATVTAADGSKLGENSVEVASPVYITGRGGTIEKVYEDLGGDVSRFGNIFKLDGDILSSALYSKIDQRADLQDDLNDVEQKLESLTVKAGTDGVISGLQLNTDQIVQAGAKLFTVKSNKQVKIDVEIDELDIAEIKAGQTATVTFDALPDKVFTATVNKINPIGVSTNNVTKFTVTLQLDATDGVMLGMSADVEIVSQTAENALFIPIEAIQVIDGEKYVVFAEEINKDLKYTPATHKVKTGITDGVNIEIIEGLAEGAQVAVPQVKELSLQEKQMQMWGDRMNGPENSKNNTSGSAPVASE